jgi:alkylhydroperoxidase family enzyme
MGDGKGTLEFALRQHAVPLAEMHKKYPSVLNVVNRILGLVPRCDGYLEIWPPAFVTYNILVPNLFDIPRCDLGLGIPPALRSLVAHVASRTYGCNYCSAHTAVMGTIFRGPGGNLTRNADALDSAAADRFSAAERAAMDWAASLAHVPADVTAETRLAVARQFSIVDEESIALAVTVMGFLNRFMDTIGMVLEWEALKTSEEHLGRTGWKPGIAFDERFDAELAAAEQAHKNGKKKLPALVPSVIGAVAYDRRVLAAVPKRRDLLMRALTDGLGFEPAYVQRIGRIAPQRALAHVLIERLNVAGDELPIWLKHAMVLVAATHAKNPLLRAHAAYLATRAGAKPEQLTAALDTSRLTGTFSEREAAALTVAHAASPAPSAMSPELVARVTSAFQPPTVIELIVVVAIAAMLQRWTTAYPTERYEPPIGEFVAQHGAALALPPIPATAEQVAWLAQLAALRR